METIMKCSECGKKISKERLKILPDTETCVKCSKVEPVVGVILTDEVITMKASEVKRLKQLEKTYRN